MPRAEEPLLPRANPRGRDSPRRCPGRVTVLGLLFAVSAIALLLWLPLREWVGIEPGAATPCNNSLDLGQGQGVMGAQPKGPACAGLLRQEHYSCDKDFCPTCGALAGLCNKECGIGPQCENVEQADLAVCLHRMLGAGELLVVLIFFFAWVNLMWPTLLPLARPTTAMAGAALIVITRKLSHDLPLDLIAKHGIGTTSPPLAAGPHGRCIGKLDHFGAIEAIRQQCGTASDALTKCTLDSDCGTGWHCLPEVCDHVEDAHQPRPENPAWVNNDAYDQIELPVICLLAGLMILKGFMEHLLVFDAIAAFIQQPGRGCRSLALLLVCKFEGNSKQLARNALVFLILLCMLVLFLIGTILGLDVGGTAFVTALVCLIGLGIGEARTRQSLPLLGRQEQQLHVAATSYQSAMAAAAERRASTFLRSLRESIISQSSAGSAGSRRVGSVSTHAGVVEEAGGNVSRSTTLLMICLVSAMLSALIMNDTVCLVFSPMIISKLHRPGAGPSPSSSPSARSRSTSIGDPFPYLVALATSANIGSALTNVGNPQNNLIGIASGLGFDQFLKFMGLPVLASMIILIVMLRVWYAEELSGADDDDDHMRQQQQQQQQQLLIAPSLPVIHSVNLSEEGLLPCNSSADDEDDEDGDLGSSSATHSVVVVSGPESLDDDRCDAIEPPVVAPPTPTGIADEQQQQQQQQQQQGRVGNEQGEGGAAAAAVEDELTETFLKEHIETPLLLLFSGQFIMVQGLVDTGLPECFWGALMPLDPLDDVGHCVGFVIAIVVLSNLISNVPLILLMRPMLSKLMIQDPVEAKAVWLVVAFVSTIAGNLVLIGSAANLIVASNAQEEENKLAAREGTAPPRQVFPANKHAKFGFTLTMLTCAVGVTILYVELKVLGWEI